MPAAPSASSALRRCHSRWSIICRRAVFPTRSFVEAADLVDKIKAIKSAEEQELIRRAAAMQDGAMRAAFAAVEPGMRDRDIAAIAQCYSQRHGSENGIYLCASMPPGKPVQFSQRHYQNRVIQAGDMVALLVEDFGPGGMYTELGRSCVVGKASAELKDEFAFALEARKLHTWRCSSRARPAKTSSTNITRSCARTGGRKKSGCIVTARATISSSGR